MLKFPFLPTVHVNFWIASFQSHYPVWRSAQEASGEIQLTTSIVWWSGLGSFTQGVDPFYKDNFLLQTKGLECRQPLKQGLWIFFGILNIPHTHLFLQMTLQNCFFSLRKCNSFSSSSTWFSVSCTPQSEFKITECHWNLEREIRFNCFRWYSHWRGRSVTHFQG